MKRIVRRPSPSMVVALLALFVSLGGGAYAALKLPPNSVGTKQLRKGSVTAAKIHKGALLGSAIVGKVAAAAVADNATHATNADNATSAGSATHATNADNATHATNADNATHATNADNATHATTAGSAPLATTLPAGQSESGTFAMAADTASTTAGIVTDNISFPIPVASAPTVTIIATGGTPPGGSGCSGTPTAPVAASGHLCIFQTFDQNVSALSTIDPQNVFAGQPAAGTTGAWIYANNAGAASRMQTTGVWIVTG